MSPPLASGISPGRGGREASPAERTDTDAAVRIQLVRNYCPQCAETAYLTVNEVRTEVTNGKEKENTTEVISKVELSSKLSALYLRRLNPPQAEASLGATPAP